MTKNSQGEYPHLVISTKELQDPITLVEFFKTTPSVLNYIVVVEYGQNGHAHIESFSQWSKPIRADKFKKKIVELYKLDDYFSKKNTKVCFNTIDSDPMYGYGYAMKENPKVFYTSLQSEYLDKCLQYWKDHQEQVNMLKKEVKKEYMTVDSLAKLYLAYLKTVKIYGTVVPCYFNNFHKQFSDEIPFSLYQKINQDKLCEWANNELARVASLDCHPPHSP